MNIIGIAAGKGGVGKSTITANLAQALTKQSNCVGIIDADVYGPSIHRLLGIEHFPDKNELGQLKPAVGRGIPYLSIAFFRDEQQSNALRAPIVNDIIQQFLHSVDWGPIDYLLIDFPPGTGDIPLTIVQQASISVILVTTPGEMALIDVNKAIHMFQQMDVPILGVINNMSYLNNQAGERQYLFGTRGGKELAAKKQLPFLGDVPFDTNLPEAVKEQKSLFDMYPESEFCNILFDFLAYLPKGRQAQHLENFEIIWDEEL
jgi:ATP-binding protein involved in chromosome partitioning